MLLRRCFCFCIAILLSCAAPALLTAQQASVDRLVLRETIQPVSAAEIQRALAQANSDGSAALLIEIDTPGGMLDSTRQIVGSILSSRVPVIVFVTPAGARAGSAGFFLLEAADVAAMSPGTNAGAAHPVLEFGKMDEAMAEKIVNDTEAFLRSYVSRRNRNSEAALAAVHASHSYTAEEALSQHLIDRIANNDAALLQALDGTEIQRLDGSRLVLHLTNARVQTLPPTLRDHLLGWLIDPNIALLFLVGGVLLIYLEFNTPGTIVPGALGTVMVLLAAFSLNLLPIRYTAVLLLVAALVLLLLEAKFGGHGALAVGGIVCLAFGTLTLVAAPIPEMGIHPLVALATSVGFGGITVVLVRLAIKAKRMKSRLGADAMIDALATTMEAVHPAGVLPEGHVLVNGEIWRAVATESIAPGSRVRVIAHDAYLLQIAPLAEEAPEPTSEKA